VSCRPDGEPPTDTVLGSLGGRFISNDGRVFFTTPDPLVPTDTNTGVREFKILTNTLIQRAGYDVYEYVDGRPQLITPGTSAESGNFGFASESTPGLYGVSANGVDVYFGAQEPLVPQDKNGVGGVRFYDARTNGGFAVNTAVAPCRAADECHGASSEPPGTIPIGTGAALGGGGNLGATTRRGKKAKRRSHRKQHRHRKRQRRVRHRKEGRRR
jgi:hypothetical protein